MHMLTNIRRLLVLIYWKKPSTDAYIIPFLLLTYSIEYIEIFISRKDNYLYLNPFLSIDFHLHIFIYLFISKLKQKISLDRSNILIIQLKKKISNLFFHNREIKSYCPFNDNEIIMIKVMGNKT
jgi:hypothetical protein